MGGDHDARTIEDVCLSPAEQFGVLVWGAAYVAEHGALPTEVPVRPLLGPEAPPVGVSEGPAELAAGAAATALREASAAASLTGMMPSRVRANGGLSPAATMRLAAVYLRAADATGARPEEALVVPVGAEEPTLARRPDIGDYRFQGWTIYPPDFRGDHVREMIRLQAWTAKPATPIE
jgi:hypothetical protein